MKARLLLPTVPTSNKMIILLFQISIPMVVKTKVNIELKLTSCVCIAQLPAHYSSIKTIPEVITHCPPLVIDAHLHSTLILIGVSHQTNISMCTVATGVDMYYDCYNIHNCKYRVLEKNAHMYMGNHIKYILEREYLNTHLCVCS